MRTAAQIAGITALAALGAMLLFVGAFGSGGACLVIGGIWFWRLYRDAD